MTPDPQGLINGYLDETLTADESMALCEWLKESPEHAAHFAEAMLLHDRLRGELLSRASLTSDGPELEVQRGGPRDENLSAQAGSSPWRAQRRTIGTTTGVVLAASVALLVFWLAWGNTSAAAVELERIIAANGEGNDRAYRIAVDEAGLPPQEKRGPSPEARRPPKPSLDEALLYVRRGGQFVLVRQTPAGLPFVTGSNGRESWAVRPDGPVRVSADLDRFNHDVPGHEHNMPLMSIQDDLLRLREAYQLQVLPAENADTEVAEAKTVADLEATRLLVAVKRPGFRGPRRVEITYRLHSRMITELRFVDMPYGPQRLTLRMTLVEQRELGPQFFDHESHHTPDRDVERE